MHGEDCRDVMGILGQRPESRGPSDQMQPPTPSRVQLADKRQTEGQSQERGVFQHGHPGQTEGDCLSYATATPGLYREGTKVRRWRR